MTWIGNHWLVVDGALFPFTFLWAPSQPMVTIPLHVLSAYERRVKEICRRSAGTQDMGEKNQEVRWINRRIGPRRI